MPVDKFPATAWELQEGTHQWVFSAIPWNQTGFLYNPDKSKISLKPGMNLSWINAHPKEFGFCDPSRGFGPSFCPYSDWSPQEGLKNKGDKEVDPAKVVEYCLEMV